MRLSRVRVEDVLTFTPEYAEMRFTPWGTSLVTMAPEGKTHTYVQFEELGDEECDKLLNAADAKTPLQITGTMKMVTVKGVTMTTYIVTAWKEAN